MLVDIRARRHVIVAAFVLSAVRAPPEVSSQLALAIPLLALYEAAIAFFRRIEVPGTPRRASNRPAPLL